MRINKKYIAIIVVIGIVVGSTIFILMYNMAPASNLNENLETDQEILLTGNLEYINDNHQGSGVVRLVKKENGDIALQFIEVDIINGPEYYVYLSDKPEFSGINDDPGTYRNLGLLPALTGTFEIEVPSNLNINSVNSVVIWCKPFSVIVTYATLKPA